MTYINTGPPISIPQSVGHCTEIRADIDRICHEEERDDYLQQPFGIVPAKVAGDAFTGDATDPGADLLYRDHQRVAEQHGPRNRKAELGACLTIGTDTAGVVVGGPGDEPRSEQP